MKTREEINKIETKQNREDQLKELVFEKLKKKNR